MRYKHPVGNKNRWLLLAGAFLFSSAPLFAQSIGPSTIDAAGSSFSGGGFSYEYAVGQLVAANTYISPGLVITHGVLQPQSPSGIGDQSIAAESLNVYPSPFENTLFLQPAFSAGGILQYGLFDAAGRLVLSREARLTSGTERQELTVAHIAAGQYFINVTWIQSGVKYVAAYKLQKLQ
jgi:hypothetical protein